VIPELFNPYQGWVPIIGIGNLNVPIYQSVAELEEYQKEEVIHMSADRRIPVQSPLTNCPQRGGANEE
jgi:hypothetical protein